MKDFWNQRYTEDDYAYGQLPNAFFKQELDKLVPGSVLLPAEGEGRNAVFAAKNGWQVAAFDISKVGKERAMVLAKAQKVTINYQVSGMVDFSSENQYDAIALIYAHFPAKMRVAAHKKCVALLKSGGTIILEGFSKQQLGKSSGGPKDEQMLFSVDEIQKEFKGIDFKTVIEDTITLDEGKYHKGPASVIRMVGTKP